MTVTAESIVEAVNAVRRAHGLLTVSETLALSERGNIIFDPFSTLISRRTVVGRDNVIHPAVSLLCSQATTLVIGNGNLLATGTTIEAEIGPVDIGHRNEIGKGGFSARTVASGARILIGDDGRYTMNCMVTGASELGSGSQIHGPIAVDSCRLGAGGSYRHDDPDQRGAVLKGYGRARSLSLARGQVIQSFGEFSMADVKPQSFYHPLQENRS